jgi:hypothetical protein
MSILLEQFIKELIAEILDESKKKKSKRGFWDNMWAKRRRREKPAKTRAQGRPDPKTWKNLTKTSTKK